VPFATDDPKTAMRRLLDDAPRVRERDRRDRDDRGRGERTPDATQLHRP
jgi:hypothetical protein